MLLLTPASRRWRRFALAAAAALLVSYWFFARGGFPHGGSPAGLAYGGLAIGLLVFLLLYSVRRRWHRGASASLETWCQAHLYLGLLVVVAALLHSGFRFHDRVAVAALVVMGLVAASGLFGAVLYTLVPFLLTGAESNLSPEELSSQLNQQALVMNRLAADRSAALQEIVRRVLAGAKPGPLAGWRLLLRPPAAHAAPAPWRALLADVPPAEAPQLDQLLVQVRQFEELHRALRHQQHYRNLLTAWLYLHVPLSAALVVLVAAHVIAACYYAF
jgi:hypothetical protein